MSVPFKSWLSTNPETNKLSLFPPAEYYRCWVTALFRMCIVINHGKKVISNRMKEKLLSMDDDELFDYYGNLDVSDRNYVVIGYKDLSGVDLDEDDKSSNFFYGEFRLSEYKDGIRIEILVNDDFLDKSYKGIRYPRDFSNKILDEFVKEIDRKFMRECASIYLIRNFWHNYVHNYGQRITHSNYRDFKGLARELSDFEADNLSLMLLAISYNLPVESDNINSYKPNSDVIRLLKRSRCNELFYLRATSLDELITDDDIMWRMCRTVSGYLSGFLLAQGVYASQVEVNMSDRYPGSFSICINGLWYHYHKPYPDNENTAYRERYLYELSIAVTSLYLESITLNHGWMEFGVHAKNANLRRLGIN